MLPRGRFRWQSKFFNEVCVSEESSAENIPAVPSAGTSLLERSLNEGRGFWKSAVGESSAKEPLEAGINTRLYIQKG